MKDHSFMNLYIYQTFSLCHAGRANLGCETNLVSNSISTDVRSRELSRAGVNFCEYIIEIWFTMDRMLIPSKFNPLQRVARLLLSWNIMIKNFFLTLMLIVP